MTSIFLRCFFFCVFLNFLSGCTDSAPLKSEAPSTPSKTSPLAPAQEEAVYSVPPRIPVPADKKLLQILNVNLDEGPEQEQILFLQTKANLSRPIQIQVVAYDTSRATYFLAWEGAATASANQNFTATQEDLVGDHQNELVVTGFDEKGIPCMDVFRRSSPPGGIGLQYRNVFSLTVAGRFEIEKPVRSPTYDSGQKSEVSDPIVVEESDNTSTNLLDTIKTTYNWKFQKNSYEKVQVEKYRRDNKSDSVLEKLFAGENSEIEGFLKGPWLKPETTGGDGKFILFFDTKSRQITFANDSAQEVYQWEVTSRTMRNGLYLAGSNDLINLIKLQMSVSITSSETIEVNVQDNPGWSGTFRRLSDSTLATMVSSRSAPLEMAKGPLGKYKSENGDEVQFDLPGVTFTEKGRKLSGVGAVFILDGKSILQVKLPSGPQNAEVTRNYWLQSKEDRASGRIVRALILQSGRLTTTGWVSDLSETQKLEQVEVSSEEVPH